MITRDAFVAALEKRAFEAPESIPANDSAQATVEQISKNRDDNRDYVHGIFSNAGAVQTQQTEEAKKLFPSTEGTKFSGNLLMKVARNTFFSVMGQGNFLKTASPMHIELAYTAFTDELEKIATAHGR